MCQTLSWCCSVSSMSTVCQFVKITSRWKTDLSVLYKKLFLKKPMFINNLYNLFKKSQKFISPCKPNIYYALAHSLNVIQSLIYISPWSTTRKKSAIKNNSYLSCGSHLPCVYEKGIFTSSHRVLTGELSVISHLKLWECNKLSSS